MDNDYYFEIIGNKINNKFVFKKITIYINDYGLDLIEYLNARKINVDLLTTTGINNETNLDEIVNEINKITIDDYNIEHNKYNNLMVPHGEDPNSKIGGSKTQKRYSKKNNKKINK